MEDGTKNNGGEWRPTDEEKLEIFALADKPGVGIDQAIYSVLPKEARPDGNGFQTLVKISANTFKRLIVEYHNQPLNVSSRANCTTQAKNYLEFCDVFGFNPREIESLHYYVNLLMSKEISGDVLRKPYTRNLEPSSCRTYLSQLNTGLKSWNGGQYVFTKEDYKTVSDFVGGRNRISDARKEKYGGVTVEEITNYLRIPWKVRVQKDGKWVTYVNPKLLVDQVMTINGFYGWLRPFEMYCMDFSDVNLVQLTECECQCGCAILVYFVRSKKRDATEKAWSIERVIEVLKMKKQSKESFFIWPNSDSAICPVCRIIGYLLVIPHWQRKHKPGKISLFHKCANQQTAKVPWRKGKLLFMYSNVGKNTICSLVNRFYEALNILCKAKADFLRKGGATCALNAGLEQLEAVKFGGWRKWDTVEKFYFRFQQSAKVKVAKKMIMPPLPTEFRPVDNDYVVGFLNRNGGVVANQVPNGQNRNQRNPQNTNQGNVQNRNVQTGNGGFRNGQNRNQRNPQNTNQGNVQTRNVQNGDGGFRNRQNRNQCNPQNVQSGNGGFGFVGLSGQGNQNQSTPNNLIGRTMQQGGNNMPKRNTQQGNFQRNVVTPRTNQNRTNLQGNVVSPPRNMNQPRNVNGRSERVLPSNVVTPPRPNNFQTRGTQLLQPNRFTPPTGNNSQSRTNNSQWQGDRLMRTNGFSPPRPNNSQTQVNELIGENMQRNGFTPPRPNNSQWQGNRLMRQNVFTPPRGNNMKRHGNELIGPNMSPNAFTPPTGNELVRQGTELMPSNLQRNMITPPRVNGCQNEGWNRDRNHDHNWQTPPRPFMYGEGVGNYGYGRRNDNTTPKPVVMPDALNERMDRCLRRIMAQPGKMWRNKNLEPLFIYLKQKLFDPTRLIGVFKVYGVYEALRDNVPPETVSEICRFMSSYFGVFDDAQKQDDQKEIDQKDDQKEIANVMNEPSAEENWKKRKQAQINEKFQLQVFRGITTSNLSLDTDVVELVSILQGFCISEDQMRGVKLLRNLFDGMRNNLAEDKVEAVSDILDNYFNQGDQIPSSIGQQEISRRLVSEDVNLEGLVDEEITGDKRKERDESESNEFQPPTKVRCCQKCRKPMKGHARVGGRLFHEEE